MKKNELMEQVTLITLSPDELKKIMDDPIKLEEWEEKAFKNYRE